MVQSSGRDPIEGTAALETLKGVKDLFVAKGQKILHFDLTKDAPPEDELLALMLGRSGKLRAPAVRTGTRLLVGYNAELLEKGLA